MGEIADLANAVGYALEGDWVNAGISAAGAVPVVGDLAKAGRGGKKVVQALVEEGGGAGSQAGSQEHLAGTGEEARQ